MNKLKSFKTGKLYVSISILAIGTILLMSIPIILFVSYFSLQEVSSDISLWGNFGDFFGGILNPIISFSSLILLGVLTVSVANQSSEAEEKLNFKLRRMDAYDLLAKGLNSLESFVNGTFRSIQFINSSLIGVENHDSMLEKYKQESLEISKLRFAVTDFNTLFQKFNIRYGHIFDYDFQSEEFNDLAIILGKIEETTSNLDIGFKSIGHNLEKNSNILVQMRKDFQFLKEEYLKYKEPMANLINNLRAELS